MKKDSSAFSVNTYSRFYYRILTMVYNFQRYWVFGLYPSSWLLKNKLRNNTTFRKLDLFPSSGEGKKPILLDPLESASLNHWTINVTNHAGFFNNQDDG
jgi:hypothetical protein